MKSRGLRVFQLAFAAVLVVITAALFSGCEYFGGDQNTFAPGGDVAQRQRDLFIITVVPATIIGILVFAAILYIALKYRRRDGDELPKQIHGNTRLEIAWTIAPAILLLGLAIPTVDGIIDLGREPHDDALHITVQGQQFSWFFEYDDPEFAGPGGRPLGVPNELHIPVDREIGVTLNSNDVIHSFWVPKLAGKLDVVPGRNNRMWFNATEPGTYSGQCAELCGVRHFAMRFTVIAHTQEEFDAWVQEQMAETLPNGPPGEEPNTPGAEPGGPNGEQG
jgi:cytochrome c oxidase subunit 2